MPTVRGGAAAQRKSSGESQSDSDDDTTSSSSDSSEESESESEYSSDADEKVTPTNATKVTRLPAGASSSNTNTAVQKAPRRNTATSEEEEPSTSKRQTQSRPTANSSTAAAQRKKLTGGNAKNDKDSATNNNAGNTTATASTSAASSAMAHKDTTAQNASQTERKSQQKPTANVQSQNSKAAAPPTPANKGKNTRPPAKAAAPPKRNITTTTNTRAVPAVQRKSSEESQSESGDDSGDESTTSSESEGSDSTNSYASNQMKGAAAKNKRNFPPNRMQQHSDSDEFNIRSQETTPRKLTRMSMRRSKQIRNTGAGSETESDLDAEKRSLSKSPAKKPAATTKCKVKKDTITRIIPQKPRSLSPPQHIEKKCPIEGCDSSGHLSGNLDKHFLPEACPIFHNMSASECKERANERKLRDEHRLKVLGSMPSANANSASSSSAATSKVLSAEQKEFLAKIKESRLRFKPISVAIKSDKTKIEKDGTDDDREPANLSGLVPDYDMQLFREAQAIASQKIEDELKELPFGKGIKYILLGKYKMKVWYQSPYPDDAARLPKMYICEFCLRYQKSETSIKRHALKCLWRHPPGDEIYRKGKLQVWQVDGKRHKQYCQHLCLLAKFFLDHKTLYYDVEPFLFYIMTLADVDGCHIVGYFSKEKNSFYNVSCILTLPPYQRKGYGRLLIDFSYLLTRVENKIGSPEKPLSDLGLISYRSYWKDILLDYLCRRTGNTISIKEVSQEMAIYSYDIVSTLQALGMMKYWKGKHIVLKKEDVLEEYQERIRHRGSFPKIDDSCLRWSPFVPTPQSNNSS